MAIPSHPLPNGGVIDPSVIRDIRQASATTQVDFGLLVAEAQQESGLNPDAKAPNSSATGLFQFIDSTWLTMVQRFGSKYGIGNLAQQISTDTAGQPRVADPQLRQQILNLRRDPSLSSDLAAEYTKLNQNEVEHALGRKASSTDLYMAHFLGSAGASQFLKAVEQNGNTAAANLFPDAAAANPTVFYDKASGTPRTVSDIYRSFSRRIESGLANIATPGAGTIGDSVSDLSSLTASALPVFQRLVLGTTALTDPVRAMMDALASTALNLLRGGETPTSAAPSRTLQRRDSDAL